MKVNGIEKQESSKILFAHRYFTDAVECAHFGIEIMLKSYLLKQTPSLVEAPWQHPFKKHDLFQLLQEAPELIDFLRQSKTVYDLLMEVVGDAICWKPEKRYYARADE